MSDHWTKGYSQSELDDAQEKFGLVFPPDLGALLREKRPLRGHDWSNDVAIRSAMGWPLKGLLFDVEQNDLWWPEWGEKPTSAEARAEVLRAVVARAPKLILLIAHRYLPETPREPGNPVFSVYQSDVIHYGANLNDYFEREFFGGSNLPWPTQIKYVPFWSDLVERN